MKKYDYYTEVTNDIECWMDKDGDPFDLSQFKNREEAAEFLHDKLYAEDYITGNGPDGYDTEEACEKYLCHNLKLIIDVCEFYDIDLRLMRGHLEENDLARYIDCFVRLYVLPDAIERALITWEEYGFKYKNI